MKTEYAMRNASLRTAPLLLALLLIAVTLTAHAQASYRITPVGDGPLAAYALNEKAEVAGSFMTETSSGRPYVWRNGVIVPLPWANTVPNEYAEAIGINDRSELAGFSSDSLRGTFVGLFWRNDRAQEIQIPNTNAVQATGINNLGQAMGLAYELDGSDHWFVWRNGHYYYLNPLRSGDSIYGTQINDLGFVVGVSASQSGEPNQRAVMWVLGQPIDLGTLPGTEQSFAGGINLWAQVVGTSRGPGDIVRPWRWENGHLVELPTLRAAEGYWAGPSRINNRGLILGTSSAPFDPQFPLEPFATIWQDGNAYDVNDLIRVNDPLKPYVQFTGGIDLNDKGQLLVRGHDSRDTNNSRPNIYLLTPIR
jgi:probable HAF family extracellular repeat protein